MADLFVSTDLNTLYNTNVRLLYFRDNAAKITTDALTADIESLDRRIATFEKVTLPSASTTAAADADFPYDREGLKREFMQEVVALLIRSSSPILTAGGEFDLEKTTLLVGGTRSEAGSVGGTHRSITYAATDSAGEPLILIRGRWINCAIPSASRTMAPTPKKSSTRTRS